MPGDCRLFDLWRGEALKKGSRPYAVNGQVEVPGGGQVKVPTPRGWFTGSAASLLSGFGLVACGRTGRW